MGITGEALELILEKGMASLDGIHVGDRTIGPSLRETLSIDNVRSPQEALIELYKRLKPGDPPTLETAKVLLQNLFFNEDRYSLSRVGRLKINKKLGLSVPQSDRVLVKDDIVGAIDYLINLNYDLGAVDDIDHLGNRRIRSVGELLQNQFRVGLTRLERIIQIGRAHV